MIGPKQSFLPSSSWADDLIGLVCLAVASQRNPAVALRFPPQFHIFFFISTFFSCFFFNFYVFFFCVCRWPTHKCCQVSVLNTKSWPCHCSGIYESNLGTIQSEWRLYCHRPIREKKSCMLQHHVHEYILVSDICCCLSAIQLFVDPTFYLSYLLVADVHFIIDSKCIMIMKRNESPKWLKTS